MKSKFNEIRTQNPKQLHNNWLQYYSNGCIKHSQNSRLCDRQTDTNIGSNSLRLMHSMQPKNYKRTQKT